MEGGRDPHVYVDGVYLRRNWGGEFENVAILLAIAVNENGYREVLGAAEGMKEDKASWVSFFQRLRGRGLDRATLVVKMLKAIHAHERKGTVGEKAKAVVEELHSVKRKEATKKIADGMEETLTYCDFPSEHWTHIRTNHVMERLNREIRRRTRVVVSFPDDNSALMPACARLCHVAGTQWGNIKYRNMKLPSLPSDSIPPVSANLLTFPFLSTKQKSTKKKILSFYL